MKKLAVVLALLVATPAFAVNGMRMIGFGPVQSTMGGVGVGASLDAGTTVSNPAGMADLGGRFDFGATYFDPTVDSVLMGQAFSSGRGATPIPAFGLVVPIGKELRFGIGAYGVAGMGADFDIGHTNYSQMRFTPAISYKLLDMLAVGATLNVMYANLDFGAYFPPPASVTIVNQGGAAFGFGATLSAKLSPIPILDVGVAYETKSSFSDFKFKGVDSTTGAPPGNITFNQPPALTFGAGLKPLPMLLVAADVQWLQWSSTQGTTNQVGSFGTLNWKDQWVYKIGAQLDLLDVLKVRAGFNYGKSPVDANSPAATFMPAIYETHVTVGAGLALASNVTLNAGTVISPKQTSNGTGPFGPQEVSVSGYTIEGGLSITY